MATATRFHTTLTGFAPAAVSLDELLDRTYSRLCAGETAAAMSDLCGGLGAAWRAGRAEWPRLLDVCRQHRVFPLLAEDPFTARARNKPRGYAGDAVMMDFIYRGLTKEEAAGVSSTGSAIFDYTAGFSAGARAVRERRDLLASRIDATARRIDKPRILAVACGHLREATISNALRGSRVGELVALDQDELSIETVRRDYGGIAAIHPMRGSVLDLLVGRVSLTGFDLVYAAGLYDSLPERIARALTANLAQRLNVGGELLVGNVLPAPHCVGYMESLMEWPLLWRTQTQVADLASRVPTDLIASTATFIDSTKSIAYLQLTRR